LSINEFVGNNLLDDDVGIAIYLIDLLMSVSVHKYNVFLLEDVAVPLSLWSHTVDMSL
jgi:hypothetical protein